MIVGLIIVMTLILIKYQPVYAVKFGGEEIGYIESKKAFEQVLEEELGENEIENVAYKNINKDVKYKLKLVDKTISSNENEILSKMNEESETVYYEYAIIVNGENKEHVNTEEEANQIVENIKQELGEELNIEVTKVYTKEKEIQNDIEIATISDNITNNIKEQKVQEKKRQEATVNGIYLQVDPVKGHITSRYGAREAIRSHEHRGLDVAAPTGTPIKAITQGTIEYSSSMSGYGNLIIIDHGNGVKTYYGHCSKLYKKVGEEVETGEVIAAVGSTGNSTGPHLHLEVRVDNKIMNPLNYVYK